MKGMTVLKDQRGEWVAVPTGFGHLLYDPLGCPVGLAATREDALELALALSQEYEAIDALILAHQPLSVEVLREEEAQEEDEEDR